MGAILEGRLLLPRPSRLDGRFFGTTLSTFAPKDAEYGVYRFETRLATRANVGCRGTSHCVVTAATISSSAASA
jgi:hypothetical protein